MFRIGEFSKLSNISIKMLRHYDEIGLLKPDEVDELSSYRFYFANKLEIASKINLYKSLGFSLKSILILLESSNGIDNIKSHLKLREIEILEEQKNIEKQLLLIKEIIEKYEKLDKINYNAVIKIIPARLVMSIRKSINSYKDESVLWNDLYENITKNKIEPIYDGYTMAIYHDDEYKEKNIDIEIQVTVEKKAMVWENINFINVPEIEVVSVTFAGSYNQMPKVTEIIASFFEQNNLRFSSKMFNIFHVSPAQTNNEEEYVTESCYVIERG